MTKLGPPLSILDIPSPTIGETCTTHNQMLFWVGWFARFHIDPEGQPYVPYAIKTLDCPVVTKDGDSASSDHEQPRRMRCAREVACHEVRGKVEWLMLSWQISVPGVTIRKFDSLDEAMAIFLAPPEPVCLP